MNATKTLATVAAAVAAALLAAGCGGAGSGHAASPPTAPTSAPPAPAVTTPAPTTPPPAATHPTTPPATSRTSPTSPTPSAALVSTAPKVHVIADCAKPAYEPSVIILACGDGNAQLINIAWSSWGRDAAVGTATLAANTCQPYCVNGRIRTSPGRLTLAGARTSPLGTLFSTAVFTFDGTPPAYMPATMNWSLTVPDTVHNLFISDEDKAQLVTAFAGAQHLTPNEIQGIVPGSVYYAYDVTTGTEWAVATILPSKWYLGLPSELQTAFQGGPWVFTQASGAAWQLSGQVSTTSCPIPNDVLAAWGKTPATCQFSPA